MHGAMQILPTLVQCLPQARAGKNSPVALPAVSFNIDSRKPILRVTCCEKYHAEGSLVIIKEGS